MITREQAEELARSWVDAFNRRDLDAVLAHYADDIEFTSPVVIEIVGDPTGTVRGKAALRSYFSQGLAKYPDLAFELLHVLAGVDSVCLVSRALHRGSVAAEVMALNAQGQVARVWVHYGPPAAGGP